MKHLLKPSLSLCAIALLFAGLLAVAPVSADLTLESQEVQSEATTRVRELQLRAENSRQELQSKRTDNEGQPQVIDGDRLQKRIDRCQTRRISLQNVVQRVAVRAEALTQKVNRFEQRLDNLVTKYSLQIDDIDRIKADIDTNEKVTLVSLETLKRLASEFNCDDPDAVVEQIEAFRLAVDEFRTNARAYIASVKVYAQAVRTSYNELLEAQE